MSEESDIKNLVDKIIEDGIISDSEYQDLLMKIHSDGKIDQEEKKQIDRVYNLIKDGKIVVQTN